MKIVFMGTPQASVPTLKRILEDGHKVLSVWTQPDRPSGRGNKLTSPPVKDFALENGLEVFQPTKIRTKKTINKFKSYNADVAVVVAYGRILSKSYLSAFPMGCINVHFSLLPKYRGAAPVNWAIVNGEKKTGITTMQMDLGLDTGDILLQSETMIGEQENSIELMDRLSIQGAELLSETLATYNQIKPIKQNHTESTLAPIMTKEMGLINWEKEATSIANQIRGFQPFPRSYTIYNNEKIIIWGAESLVSDTNDYKCGEIVESDGDNLQIACGKNTTLKINELQMPGKRRMKTRDVLNGYQIIIGSKFGK